MPVSSPFPFSIGPAGADLGLFGNIGDQIKQLFVGSTEEAKKKNAGSQSMLGSAAASLGLPY